MSERLSNTRHQTHFDARRREIFGAVGQEKLASVLHGISERTQARGHNRVAARERLRNLDARSGTDPKWNHRARPGIELAARLIQVAENPDARDALPSNIW